ncbi:MAG: hypothetical protein J6B85_13285 [Lachnospiraceae bacterium]|nr:hypothetical protein [Lachnospiraceae bacterium]
MHMDRGYDDDLLPYYKGIVGLRVSEERGYRSIERSEFDGMISSSFL